MKHPVLNLTWLTGAVLLLASGTAAASRVDYHHAANMHLKQLHPHHGHHDRHDGEFRLDDRRRPPEHARDERRWQKRETTEPVPVPDWDNSILVYEKVELFEKKEYLTGLLELDVAGTYAAILTDFEFPSPMKASGLSITSGREKLGAVTAPGWFTFEAGPGDYHLSFFGLSGFRSQLAKFGQYGIQVHLLDAGAAVPVPGAAWLFGSGLIGLAGVTRRLRSDRSARGE
jgi:hypothetical protein